ncbi:MAG: DUF6149 family protein [archaeon]
MKIKQSVKHWAAKQSLTAPIVGDLVADRLVDLHTGVFLEWAAEDRREERRDRLEAFFAATMDSYVAALREGYTEAEAREMTHAQANFDFFNHGWTEMMEFPLEEVEPHYDRYAEFFEAHGISIEDPLGEFEPDGGLPSAPSTPEKLDDPDHPHAIGGFADDVYAETPDGDVVAGGGEEPDEVSLEEAPGVDAETVDTVDVDG